MEPLVASTDEYLAKQIKEDRSRLERCIRELETTVVMMRENLDAERTLDEQDHLRDHFGDLVELSTEIQLLVVRIDGMESVPRVG